MRNNFFFIVLILLPRLTLSMHVQQKIEPKFHSPIDAAIYFLESQYPEHTVFNSADARCLNFLADHQKRIKDEASKKAFQKHQAHLSMLYIVNLKHTKSVEDPSLNSYIFIVDTYKNYIKKLPQYPETVEEKIQCIAEYFIKSSSHRHSLVSNTIEELCRSYSLVSNIPEELCHAIKKSMRILKKEYTQHLITDCISLDKRDESKSYFVLFRLKNMNDQTMSHFVYELCHNNRFEWDAQCSNLTRYYQKHRNFFTDVALGKRLA